MRNLKVGQKVFDYLRQEWATITGTVSGDKYPIRTERVRSYTTEGRYHEDDAIPRLSLTEWNPITGTGKFTSIDQELPIQVGDKVYFWDREDGPVLYGVFGKYDDERPFPYYSITCNNWWVFVSKERPQWIP